MGARGATVAGMVTLTAVVTLGGSPGFGAAVSPAAAGKKHHVTISTVSSKAYGHIASNRSGRVVYLFEKDGKNKSHCGSDCRSIWPRVMSGDKPAAEHGIRPAHLSRTKAGQVTYYGHPLYYYVGDSKAKQHHGEGLKQFGARWYVVSTSGKAVKHKKSPAPKPPASSDEPTLTLESTPSYGDVLSTSTGHTLYLHTTDSPTSSTCTGSCSSVWPALATDGSPKAGPGVDGSRLGSFTRPDGTTQVTYNGHPLYEYAGDAGEGDTNGEASGSVWYLVDSDGDAVTG